MKIKIYTRTTFLTTLLVMASLLLSSCSKDNGADDGPASGKGGVSMKVDGDPWKSTTNTMMTKEVESGEMEKYHIVVISALRGNGDDLSESLSLYVNIPASKFRNPKGTYQVAIEEEEKDHTWAVLAKNVGTDASTLYVSADPDQTERTMGVLEITGFEIGNQKLPGQASGEEGYTKLSGSFHFELYSVLGTGDRLEVTEGRFDLTSGFDFGWGGL